MAIFSQRAQGMAHTGSLARLTWMGSGNVAAQLDAIADPEIADAVRWLYASSPLGDWTNYDFQLFQDCGKHGVFLRKLSPDLPEDLFLQYVLPLRVNEEELSGCRSLFYSLLSPRLRGLGPRDMALEVNRWCAEQVAYRSTDSRTRSALAVWKSGFGRCGEESVFAVNAFRAVGIPARQIYTPRWAHCDDNHAWVEVWVDGEWHFLGACEPEAVLDRGWFTNAASRAMVIHSRRFGPSDREDEMISQSGAVAFLNQISRYANTKTLTVRVTDSGGSPVEGAEVRFGILNMAEIFPAAAASTGADGTVRLVCGLGTFCVRVRKNGTACERLVPPETDVAEIVLEPEIPALDVWEDFTVAAPRDRPAPAPQPSEAQKALGREWAAEAGRKRAQRGIKFPAFSPEEEVVLRTLPEKDRLDADPEVLREAWEISRAYDAESPLFWHYVVCPRVADEPLRPNRRFILQYFPQNQQDAFRKHPREIWKFIRTHISSAPALEYDRLVTLPVNALATHSGSPLSQRILFVSICRALGVPARMADGRAEYWDGSGFRAVDASEKCCTITLESPEQWQDGADFSVGVLEDGIYETLRPEGPTFSARPGDYRIITANRLPNGDQFASKYHFHLEPGETKTVRLQKYQADLSQMLSSYHLEEFTVSSQDGRAVPGSALTRRGGVLLWLEEGEEPTEHILSEMLDRREEFRKLPVAFLVRGPGALEDRKLRQVLEALPDIQVFYDSFVPNVETIARRVYVDHEKLPLIVVAAKPLNAVYASSGYNVGCGDMILRVCESAL